MKQSLASAITALVLTIGTPVWAEESDKGTSLMEEGAKLFFRGLMSEMEPALRELEELADNVEPALRSFAEEMGPALRDLMQKVDDWTLYHPPEILPNGDIILRRKTPQEILDDPNRTPEEIEL